MAKKTTPKVTKLNPPLFPLFTILLILSLSLFAYVKWSTRLTQSSNVPAKTNTVAVVAPISLPKPSLSSKTSIESALQNRRTVREFTPGPINLKMLSQMLWSAQGVTADWGGKTTPSAKSAYPLTLYILVNRVGDLKPGVYRYISGDREMVHQIVLEKSENIKDKVAEAIGQNSAKDPAAIVFVVGDMDKMAKAFDGKRVDNNVYLEAGHAAQNMYLQAQSLGLGMVAVAGFNGDKVKEVLGIPTNLTIIYAIPIGLPKK